MFAKFALRDLSIVGITLLAWWALADRSGGTGLVSDFTGFVAGALMGASAYVLHEWGHLLGAFASGSTVHPSGRLGSAFVFSYDARANSLAQFLVMSFAGFAATAAVIAAYYLYLPDGLLATRIARGAALFLAFLGVVLEVPLVLVAVRKRAVPAVAAVKVPRPERQPAA